MRKQEQTRLAELAAEKAHHEAIQAQVDIVSYHLSQTLYPLMCWFFVIIFLRCGPCGCLII